MTYRRGVRFKREFALLSPEIKRIARATFALFSQNWRHPFLRAHKLEGFLWHGHQVFDLWGTDRYRVLSVIDHDVVVSFSIGRTASSPNSSGLLRAAEKSKRKRASSKAKASFNCDTFFGGCVIN
jgi:hypothetical protein